MVIYMGCVWDNHPKKWGSWRLNQQKWSVMDICRSKMWIKPLKSGISPAKNVDDRTKWRTFPASHV